MKSEWYADGTSGHQGDGSKDAEPSRRLKIDRAFGRVLDSEETGVTWKELAEMEGWHHGESSSALSNLHRQGRVERLRYKRNGSGVYVAPSWTQGRQTAPYRARVKPVQPTRRDIEQAVDAWWEHARFSGKERLVDILCEHLEVKS